MAQIANVRRFDGVDDEIGLAVASIGGINVARTVVAIAKITTTAGSHSILSAQGGGAGEWSFQHVGDDLSLYGVAPQINSPDAFIPNAVWCLLAVSRPDGVGQTARWHKYNYNTSTWTHTDDDVTHDDRPDPVGGKLWIGTYEGTSEFAQMDLAVLGTFTANLNDTQIETLETDIAAWDALAAHCWLLDQSSTLTAVADRIGNCDELAIVGTTALSEGGLAFDVGGGGGGGGGTHPDTFRPVQSNLRW